MLNFGGYLLLKLVIFQLYSYVFFWGVVLPWSHFPIGWKTTTAACADIKSSSCGRWFSDTPFFDNPNSTPLRRKWSRKHLFKFFELFSEYVCYRRLVFLLNNETLSRFRCPPQAPQNSTWKTVDWWWDATAFGSTELSLWKHDNVWNIETHALQRATCTTFLLRLELKNSLDKQDVFSVIMPTHWHSTWISRFY